MLWRYEQQKNVSPEARKLEADARYRELKAEMTEIQRDILNGKYIASAEVYKTLVECFGKNKINFAFYQQSNSNGLEFSISGDNFIDKRENR